jgi:hypothetical protein
VTDTDDVTRYSDAIMSMIKEDQDNGQVPRDVASVDELDNFVDLEDYYRQVSIPSGSDGVIGLRDAVRNELGRRLAAAQGGPWHVIWQHPGGGVSDVGRAVGYPTREEAEAVGRGHVTAHGGGFHLRNS